MKITKAQLTKIIKEEMRLIENVHDAGWWAQAFWSVIGEETGDAAGAPDDLLGQQKEALVEALQSVIKDLQEEDPYADLDDWDGQTSE